MFIDVVRVKKMKMIGLLSTGNDIVSNKDNVKNTKDAVKNWNLGAADAYAPSPVYWAKAAKIWAIPVEEAKLQMCGNCEYFNNTKSMLKKMKDEYPLNEFDTIAEGKDRGYCHKLKFACHMTRSCQAWEEKDYEVPEDTDMEEED